MVSSISRICIFNLLMSSLIWHITVRTSISLIYIFLLINQTLHSSSQWFKRHDLSKDLYLYINVITHTSHDTQQLTMIKRHCLSKDFFMFGDTTPDTVDPWVWIFAWIFVSGALSFFVYWMFAWGEKLICSVVTQTHISFSLC